MLSGLGIRKGTAKQRADEGKERQLAAAAISSQLLQLIGGGLGQTGAKLYAITANHINQAVLGFTQTTANFKKQQLPKYVSIPDILNMQGQVARCYAETCFQKFIGENLQRLRDLAEVNLIKEFTQFKLNLRQGFVSTGMGDVMLTAEACVRKTSHSMYRHSQ